MKRFALVTLMFLAVAALSAQEVELKDFGSFPEVNVKNVDGQPFNTKDLNNDGKPMIVTFWATWCKPCMKEHDAINDVYEDWVDETGVKLYAVSIDNSRSMSKVKPTVNGRGWEFDVICDPNSDLKRAVNVNQPPHTFILDGDGVIRWQHVGYMDGDELEYIKVVDAILNEK